MLYFIVNATAGLGKGRSVFNKLKKSRTFKESNVEYVFTEYASHAEEIAEAIPTRQRLPRCVVVVGGDGTLHEVVNGLEGSGIPVAFIPGGSGNDFARGALIKGTPVNILKRIVKNYASTRPYWNGSYQIDKNAVRQFVNSMGFGFDAEVTQFANTSSDRKKSSMFRISSLSYVFALVYMIFRFQPVEITLKLDGVTRVIPSCWMVTLANHPYYGGGMKIIPHATIQPNILQVLVIHSISKWKMLTMFLTVFTGKHLSLKEIECFEASTVEIQTTSNIRYQVDGQTGLCTYCHILKNGKMMEVQGHTQ